MRSTVYSHRETAICLLLRALRRDKKMTQQELALRLGKPQSYVAKVEAGARQLSVSEWLDILAALKADPVSFVRALMATPKRKPR